jgi:hypothetical protein
MESNRQWLLRYLQFENLRLLALISVNWRLKNSAMKKDLNEDLQACGTGRKLQQRPALTA